MKPKKGLNIYDTDIFMIQILEYYSTLNGVALHLKAQVCNLGILLDLQLMLDFAPVLGLCDPYHCDIKLNYCNMVM